MILHTSTLSTSLMLARIAAIARGLRSVHGLMSVATWAPVGLQNIYERGGGNSTPWRELERRDCTRWMNGLLTTELSMDEESALLCAVLHNWRGSVWSTSTLIRNGYSNEVDVFRSSSNQVVSSPPTGAVGLAHWVCCSSISGALATELLQVAGSTSAVTQLLGRSKVSSWFTEDEHRPRTMDCALQPIVSAASTGAFGPLPCPVTTSRLRFELGVPLGVPLSKEVVDRLDEMWSVKRLVWRKGDGRVWWFNGPPKRSDVILLVHENSCKRNEEATVWGGGDGPASCPKTANAYREDILGLSPIESRAGDEDWGVTSSSLHSLSWLRLPRTEGGVLNIPTSRSPGLDRTFSVELDTESGMSSMLSSLGSFTHASGGWMFKPATGAASVLVGIWRASYRAQLMNKDDMLALVEFNPIITFCGPSQSKSSYLVQLKCQPMRSDRTLQSRVDNLSAKGDLSARAYPQASLSCSGHITLSIQLYSTPSDGKVGLFEYLERPCNLSPPCLTVSAVKQRCHHELGFLLRCSRIEHPQLECVPVKDAAMPIVFLSCSLGNSFWADRGSILDGELGGEGSFLDDMKPWALPDHQLVRQAVIPSVLY